MKTTAKKQGCAILLFSAMDVSLTLQSPW